MTINYWKITLLHTFQSRKRLYNHKCPSVSPSVCHQNPSTAWNHHTASFILHLSSFFIHPSSLFIHPSFISRLLSFSACFEGFPKVSKNRLALKTWTVWLLLLKVSFFLDTLKRNFIAILFLGIRLSILQLNTYDMIID